MDASAPSGGYGPYHSCGEKALSPYLGAYWIVWGRIMNVGKLRKLKRYILAEPRRYHQHWWMITGDKTKHPILATQKPPCGTVACLAGNACLMEGFRPHPDNCNFVAWKREKELLDVADVAQDILGLSDEQTLALFRFDGSGWSQRAYRAYYDATTISGRARAATMAIDDLIATNTKKKPVTKSKH
jgi:hypothetical protein